MTLPLALDVDESVARVLRVEIAEYEEDSESRALELELELALAETDIRDEAVVDFEPPKALTDDCDDNDFIAFVVTVEEEIKEILAVLVATAEELVHRLAKVVGVLSIEVLLLRLEIIDTVPANTVLVTIGRVERVECGDNEEIAVFEPKPPLLLVTEISGERDKDFIPLLERVTRALTDKDDNALGIIVILLLVDIEESTVCVISKTVGVAEGQTVPLEISEAEASVEIDVDTVDVRVVRIESLCIPLIVFPALRETLTEGDALKLTTLVAEIVIELQALILDERDAGTFVGDDRMEAVIVAVIDELTVLV